jgi:hypothetical protein
MDVHNSHSLYNHFGHCRYAYLYLSSAKAFRSGNLSIIFTTNPAFALGPLQPSGTHSCGSKCLAHKRLGRASTVAPQQPNCKQPPITWSRSWCPLTPKPSLLGAYNLTGDPKLELPLPVSVTVFLRPLSPCDLVCTESKLATCAMPFHPSLLRHKCHGTKWGHLTYSG